ncbi:MAG TPA: DNA repair protein RadA [Acidimicrobiales bacterium]|nr:DNA repair protein RadA [Acidimicrobiales bacterium]
MTRLRTMHRCRDCGGTAAQWSGRCATCGGWNTLDEEVEAPARPPARSDFAQPVLIGHVDTSATTRLATGVGELDRVLAGGLVPGSVTLVGGEPGIGKSTLLLQALAGMAQRGHRALLVSGEESASQVRLRAERLEALSPRLWLVPETSLPGVAAAVDRVDPAVVVIDSIQTLVDPELEPGPGSVTQVRHCASALVALARRRGLAVVLAGQVTKDGGLAGPRVLEHLVDTVLSFEGERHHALRLLRAVKHRFGATGELGLFEMAECGLVGVADPGQLFLGDRRAGTPGSVVVPTMEGHRPLVVELQALVNPTDLPMPRRSAQGLDPGRLALVVAVLARRAGVSLARCDVYASVVGGVRVADTAADLAMALALASAASGLAVPSDTVALAEIGLGGELRQVGHTPRRLAEAARLGFKRAVVAPSSPDGPAGLTLVRAPTLGDALARFGATSRQ